MSQPVHRRSFLQASLGAAAVLAGSKTLAAAEEKKPKLKKAVKYGMIQIDGSVEDRFNLIKRLGFEGVEMDSPSNVDRAAAIRARDRTGIVIHGVVDSVHWNDRLSDPRQEIRAKGLKALRTALEDAHAYGATTALLVPGKVSNKETENYDQVWERSQAEVRKVLPLAEQLGVKIAIEVVWNDFITTPEELIRYVDAFHSPQVGAYFDCSNMIRYGVKSGDWIRKLGKRMLKFDFKGFSMSKYRSKENPWVPIGEGDEDWPDVLKALAEVGYNGWATAEVAGGGEKELRDVAQRMNRCLGLSEG
jgi:hexulose-6-phosphate isomerase